MLSVNPEDLDAFAFMHFNHSFIDSKSEHFLCLISNNHMDFLSFYVETLELTFEQSKDLLSLPVTATAAIKQQGHSFSSVFFFNC